MDPVTVITITLKIISILRDLAEESNNQRTIKMLIESREVIQELLILDKKNTRLIKQLDEFDSRIALLQQLEGESEGVTQTLKFIRTTIQGALTYLHEDLSKKASESLIDSYRSGFTPVKLPERTKKQN